jgi:uncharacterized protein with GYD domain
LLRRNIDVMRKRAFTLERAERWGAPAAQQNNSTPLFQEGSTMPLYVTLANFTDQGMREVKGSVKRAEDFKKAAKQLGISVKEIMWLQGPYDLMTIAEAPDEAAIAALALNVGKLGNVRGQTMRAFTSTEMSKIVEKIA